MSLPSFTEISPETKLVEIPVLLNYIYIFVICKRPIPNIQALDAPLPAAHVALLQTEIYSGLRFPERMGMNSGMQGCTWAKQALVRSPSRAKLDWRTSGIESWGGGVRHRLEERRLSSSHVWGG